MNKGDTIPITLNYTVDGASIQKDAYDDIILDIGCYRLKRSTGEIRWDSGQQKYTAVLTPAMTKELSNFVRYQLTIINGSTTVSSEIETFGIGGKIDEC